MKKKIKDLTFKEAQQICKNKSATLELCDNCPLEDYCQGSFNYFDDEDLDEEIEVEE